MSKNSGIIMKWPNDKRTFIVYQDKQPLLASHGKVILVICDEEGNPSDKTILQSVEVYNERVRVPNIIKGFID